jgi:hypothetical protein
MSQEPEDDDLEPEYDFEGAVRGKYYQRYQRWTNIGRLREGEAPSPVRREPSRHRPPGSRLC